MPFHLLVHTPGESPDLSTHQELPALVSALTALVAEPVPGRRVWVFEGERLFTSTWPRPYLIHQDKLHPLFQPDTEPLPDLDGLLGPSDEPAGVTADDLYSGLTPVDIK